MKRHIVLPIIYLDRRISRGTNFFISLLSIIVSHEYSTFLNSLFNHSSEKLLCHILRIPITNLNRLISKIGTYQLYSWTNELIYSSERSSIYLNMDISIAY